MNVNTSTLLNILSSNVTNNIKQKIEKHSVDGKVNVDRLIKDKSIQTIISNLFKDISNGSKTKDNVASLLINNKQSFNFKNLADDIKNLVKSLEADTAKSVTNPKLASNITLLKTSLVDIKNLDAKILKTNITNSGVFLESKLAQQTVPIDKSINNLSNLVKEQLNLISSKLVENGIKEKIVSNSQKQNIVNNIVNQSQTQQSNQQPISNLSQLLIQQTQQQITSKQNIPQDLKLQIKTAVENILNDVRQIQVPKQKLEVQMSLLNKIETSIANLDQTVTKSNIKNDIASNMKELLNVVKDQVQSKNLTDIKNIITKLAEQITNLKPEQQNATNIKNEFSQLQNQFKSIDLSNKNPQQLQTQLTNFMTNVKSFQQVFSQNFSSVLLENNLGNIKNISGDLKNIILQIEQQLEASKEPVSKELKATVEKVLSQIDFFQLSSYSTNSNHTFLSFIQDGIDDVDIKFNKSQDDSFSCQINLTLKEHGDLKVLLVLDKKTNLNINIGIENQEFKQKVQETLQSLRVGINTIGLNLQSLNIFGIDMGQKSQSLGGYGDNVGFDLGLDIKA